MIPVTIEPESLTQFGSENCCFCYKVTKFWYEPKDVAVCVNCATTHSVDQVPTKKAWCEAVRKRAKAY